MPSSRRREHAVSNEAGLLSRLRRGMGAQGFAQAVQVLIRLTEVPLLLGAWGTGLYGEWLIVSAFPAYLVMADGGLSGTASREMAMRASAGDRQGALSVFHGAWALLLLLSAAFGLAGLAVAWLVPLGEWLGFAAMDAGEVSVVLALLVVYVLASLQASAMNGGFWCEGRYATPMFLNAASQLLEFAGLAAAVLLGGGPVLAAAGYVAGRLAGLIWMRVSLHRVSPWVRFGWSQASGADVRRLLAPSIASLAFPFANALNIQGMRIVLGATLGPVAVAVFTSIRTLSRVAMHFTTMISRLVEPEIALAFGGSQDGLVRLMLGRACQASLWLGALACLALLLAGDSFLALWTHGKVAMDWPLFGLLLAGALANALWAPALMVAYATNRHQRTALFYSLVYGVAALATGYVGSTFLGLAGAGLALLLAELAVAIYVVPAAMRMSGERWQTWTRTVLSPPRYLARPFP